ncbi:MAG: DUF1800 domain-containing protein [Rhodocyclaceae bacterium]|jgi:uncharacterized protein (DUF1800 family)|nr:DUF1800 domain-containing protein [Rhodocyclaceae bacterium]MCA3075559.1 DUF1800 domain-containing protein [Rhodocyclaceae bacterium]MCA3092087.1 DUF1800 domain-containing protein [Rhodocyclaceae bacterium]MCA3095956.1 DUF1800 domain-containing protein [Rhodocyclaceae bacterium]MCA3101617.1 DUF1800 domain-containing protein [Rhodocyclaceae bacterium]
MALLMLLGLPGLPDATRLASAAAPPAPALTEQQAIWRAASRLGYWPSEQQVAVMRAHPGGPRGWALDEVDRAFEASLQPARIPEQLSQVTAPLPDVFAEVRREREARQRANNAAAAGAAEAGRPFAAAPPAPQTPAASREPAAQPPSFVRTSAQQAAAWRILSCSDPAVENPLLSRLTEFWFNHLNVFVGRATVRPFTGHYAVHAIRPNVLGRFEDLLLASARHPAMLFYLDQNQNVADGTPGPRGTVRGLNENYARELLELHTLGVDGGYTQQDVRELARVLTGWTVDPGAPSGFRFAPRLHDGGEKTVLGRRFGGPGSAQGEREGVEAIALLASRPATARRIALRLARFFVADEPPRALVDRLAAAYLAGNGDLRGVMRQLVASPEFWDPANELFKTPYDFACSALGASARTAAAGNAAAAPAIGLALGFLAAAGQPVNGWQTPDGYGTDAATWLSPESLTRRADLAAALARGMGEPEQLLGFYDERTRERIRKVPAASRAALALAAPDFMRK